MPLWLILALGSVVVLTVSEIAQKFAISSKDNISAEANNFVVWNIQGSLALIFLLLFVNPTFPVISITLILKLLVLAIIYFWGGTLFYTSYKGSSAGLSAILGTISTLVSTTIGISLFHESINPLKFLGIILVLLAIFIVKYSKEMKFDKYNLYALAGGLIFGVAFSLDKYFVLSLDPHLYQIIFCFSIGYIGLLFRGKKIITDIPKISFSSFKAMIVSGIFSFGFNKFTFLAYKNGGEVGRIDAINNLSLLFIVLLEYFILKNKTDLPKKMIAAIVAFSGLFILGYFK
ncbi:MAG: EamA family transporter [Candidatus Shapirobacteria bacterium]|jgi:drug/metabolite transporter (DMT)-like permease